MDNFNKLVSELFICYENSIDNMDDYKKLSNSEKHNLCRKPRDALTNYLNSSHSLMTAHIQEEIRKMESICY